MSGWCVVSGGERSELVVCLRSAATNEERSDEVSVANICVLCIRA